MTAVALLVAGVSTARAPGPIDFDIVETSDNPSVFQIDLNVPDGVAVVFADVLVDEEFTDRHGSDWRDALDLMIGSANDVLSEVGVQVQVDSISTWHSDDDQAHISRILDGALDEAQRGSDRILLAVTCQDSIRLDGVSRTSRSAVIVRYNHDDWQRNGSLIAHEMGHLLGADHHGADEKCESDGCLMEPSGYANATEWCDDHRDAIGAFVAEIAV
ncbi:MAG: hypothetical protein HOF43_06050 [Chloroflexi bacterium]|nr:hypothetical protein [Chloroflexota bacterium]